MEEVIELYELSYSDLLLLSADETPKSPEEIRRLELISQKLMQNLGPNGPGMLCINGVPKSSILRQNLLPLARKLALLSNEEQKRILKVHNLGSDVALKNPDRIVSSFAMQLKYDRELDKKFDDNPIISEAGDAEFENLGFGFQELGFCMMDLGIRIARICDKKLGGRELEQSLLHSGSAKCRLIHYHSPIDNAIIREMDKEKRRDKVKLKNDVKLGENNGSNLWQQWHYDYGIFTILTNPMFMLSNGNECQECESPSSHTYLQILHRSKNRTFMVKASKDSFIVQVGEWADILSKGKLRTTLHCVRKPDEMDNLSRESFVVFLQPSWSNTLSLLDYPIEHIQDSDFFFEENESNGSIQKIREIVPPLSSRLKDGMSFAEFSRETTKRYYGGRGLQSNR